MLMRLTPCWQNTIIGPILWKLFYLCKVNSQNRKIENCLYVDKFPQIWQFRRLFKSFIDKRWKNIITGSFPVTSALLRMSHCSSARYQGTDSNHLPDVKLFFCAMTFKLSSVIFGFHFTIWSNSFLSLPSISCLRFSCGSSLAKSSGDLKTLRNKQKKLKYRIWQKINFTSNINSAIYWLPNAEL